MEKNRTIVSSEDEKGDEPDSRSRSISPSLSPSVRRSNRVRSIPDRYQSVDFRRTMPSRNRSAPRPLSTTTTSSGSTEASSTTTESTQRSSSAPYLVFAWGFGEVDVNALRRQLSRYGSVQYIRLYHNSRRNNNKAEMFFKTKRGALSALRAIRLGKLFHDFGISYAVMGDRNPRAARMHAENDQ